jgi:MATE family multidrug resistance protein
VSLLLWPAGAALQALGQPTEVAGLAGAYARACIPGTLAFFWFSALRQTFQAFGRVGPIVATIVLANIANALLDWVLIFGLAGLPALGVLGAAWATSLSRWIMCLSLAAIGWRLLRPHIRGSWRQALTWPAIRAMLRIGLPIGVHQWVEIAAFGGALLLMGRFGTIPLAAHNVTITIVALTYMVPLGTSAAAAVLVGHAIGRGDADGARREASAALACGVGFMAVSAVVIFTIPETLVRLFTADTAVLALAAQLLPIAAAFQVFDGIQGVSSGILRGAGDTRVPMLVNVLGFTGIGLPAAAWFAFGLGFGPPGIWWGLVVCLVGVSAMLAWRVHVRLGDDLRRVEH